MSYCVVCEHVRSGTIKVVGPFTTWDAAVASAQEMRSVNRSWKYQPERQIAPTESMT